MEFIDNLSGLPDWDDENTGHFNEETESWQTNPVRDACKAMYIQWQQVMVLLNGLLESIEPKDDMLFGKMVEESKNMVLNDAIQVAVKIRSSEAGDMYVLKMENAAIIRKNAQFIKTYMMGLIMDQVIDEQHGFIIRDEIDKFRHLFINWVSLFEVDEFEDEWGLFL